MTSIVSNSLPAFGFLTVVEDQQHGFFGGYLVLSELGRPLEFHCSTPVLPNQAQKILYGSTLRPYVLGELVGQTLVKKAQVPVQAVLTDSAEMLSLALVWPGVLACVTAREASDDSDTNTDTNTDADTDAEAELSPTLELDNYRLLGSSTCRWQADALRETLTPLVSYVDLEEPFQRIREAIQEAQRVTELPAEHVEDTNANDTSAAA